MTPLHKSILSTLALHSAESHPYLSLEELWDHLHKNPDEKDARAPTLREVAHGVSELTRDGNIIAHNGFYALTGSVSWQEKNITAEKKLGRARFAIALLKTIPFVRAIAVTGSVSFDNAKETSDLDLFILTKRGRIWTVRLLALAILELLGKRRNRASKTDKICLNYFLADGAQPPVQNVASATLFKRAVPLFGSKFFFEFISRNAWMQGFLFRPNHREKENINRETANSFFKNIGELILIGTMGSLLERWARSWQVKRLKRKKGGNGDTLHFMITDDIIMLHHPAPKNKEVMARYHHLMAELKLRTTSEDS